MDMKGEDAAAEKGEAEEAGTEEKGSAKPVRSANGSEPTQEAISACVIITSHHITSHHIAAQHMTWRHATSDARA